MNKIIKFYSDSCVPCKAMAPIFKEFVEGLDGVEVEEINISNPAGREKAVELGLRSVPTFVAYHDDGSMKTHTGMATLEMLAEKLN